jgi:hypothetical protein
VPMLHPATAVQLEDDRVDQAMVRFTRVMITAGFVVPALAVVLRWIG